MEKDNNIVRVLILSVGSLLAAKTPPVEYEKKRSV